MKSSPRLNPAAMATLENYYVSVRQNLHRSDAEDEEKGRAPRAVPITVNHIGLFLLCSVLSIYPCSIHLSQLLQMSIRLHPHIQVRQLEAVVRISESIAKMRLSNVATEDDVQQVG